MSEVEFQDMMWSFFQHCWHVKDWIKHDPIASDAQKVEAIRMAHASDVLKICRDLCNGTKHLLNDLGLARPRDVLTTIRPTAGHFEMDCTIDDGHGSPISGKQLARQCIAEWVSILESQGLNTMRLS